MYSTWLSTIPRISFGSNLFSFNDFSTHLPPPPPRETLFLLIIETSRATALQQLIGKDDDDGISYIYVEESREDRLLFRPTLATLPSPPVRSFCLMKKNYHE